MTSLPSVFKHLRDFIYDETPSSTALFLPIVLVLAVFCNLVHNKAWLIEALERDYERSSKKMFSDLKIIMTKDEAIQYMMNDWPRMQCIYLQHLIGSLLCVPALLRIGDPQVASTLACLGVLSEMGWEVQDLAEMLFVRAFYKNGHQIWPTSVIMVFMVHHSLTMILGIPMIKFYGSSRILHWLCFDLEFAAFLGCSLGEYTKLLNVKDPSQLRRFKIANFIALVTMIWTRVFHWAYLCANLFVVWYNDRAWMFLFFGAIISIAFSGFSMVVCVMPFYSKFVKFLNVSAEYEVIENDLNSSIQDRRSSVANLEHSVADLLQDSATRKLTGFMESVFAPNNLSKRHSISVIKVAPQSVVGRKRHSMMMMKEYAEKLKHM
eukprot:scaffold6683_cov68-Cyclotella_meneghiniana.AAC.5